MDDETVRKLEEMAAEIRAYDAVTGEEITDDKSALEAERAGHDIIYDYHGMKVIMRRAGHDVIYDYHGMKVIMRAGFLAKLHRITYREGMQ
jgi:hypothetical protein